VAGAGEVWFYHLERSSLEQVLPELLERTLARGWKARIVSPLAERLDRLDQWLWTFREDSFLPHGVEGEPNEARQPVLLSSRVEAGREALFLLDGAEPDQPQDYERCILIFDGADETRVKAARETWKRLKGLGASLQYWSQTEAGWKKTA
jgi:DNA polymerase III subunit chi